MARAREAAQRIVRDGYRASDVLNNIRALLKTSAPTMSQLDLNRVIRDILELMRDELSRHDVVLQIDLCRKLRYVRGNRTQLQQVLINLIKNAIESMSDSVARPLLVRVSTAAQGQSAVVAVEDFGSGFDAIAEERMFEPFFTTKGEGTGVGLPICRSIVEAHRGVPLGVSERGSRKRVSIYRADDQPDHFNGGLGRRGMVEKAQGTRRSTFIRTINRGLMQVRRSVLLCMCVIAIAWMPQLAGAPSTEPAKHNFSIESQPLGTALQVFAKQSGVQIIFFSQVTEGIRAPALSGPYTITAALQILLSGSHLTFRVINPKTIEITSQSRGDAARAGRSLYGTRLPKKRAIGATASADDKPTSTQNAPSLDEITVDGTAEGLVATRTATPLREIPQTVSIISQEQMRQQNDADLADALRHATGITLVHMNSLSQTFISRGFTITTLHVDGGAPLYSTPGTPIY